MTSDEIIQKWMEQGQVDLGPGIADFGGLVEQKHIQIAAAQAPERLERARQEIMDREWPTSIVGDDEKFQSTLAASMRPSVIDETARAGRFAGRVARRLGSMAAKVAAKVYDVLPHEAAAQALRTAGHAAMRAHEAMPYRRIAKTAGIVGATAFGLAVAGATAYMAYRGIDFYTQALDALPAAADHIAHS